MELPLSTESHVPCFQERGGTSMPGYMIPDRLPWRLRARPSATLHEILSAPKGKLVLAMLHGEPGFVNRILIWSKLGEPALTFAGRVAPSRAPIPGKYL